MAGNETFMGTLLKDHSKKKNIYIYIYIYYLSWYVTYPTTCVGSWVYTFKAVQLHSKYLIFVHHFPYLHNGNNIYPTVLL